MLDAERYIAVIGLGYVGWPLFTLISSKYKSWGLDADTDKVESILFEQPKYKNVTSSWDDISKCNTFIVAVPTPINHKQNPDTSSLENVCKELVNIIKKGDLVIFESTVYPGATEEICVPLIEHGSGLVVNKNFYIGYSPERINVADSAHKLGNTAKIVSGSNEEALYYIANLYESIIDAPVVKASSIKVAEAAKMYENVQRDILIALANEYSDYCDKEGIDIFEVTKCASTKWNFSNVLPGLVGGHCIGVDPYYLLHRAEKLGIKTPLVQCGRLINETKASIVVSKITEYISVHLNENPKVLLLGFAYKSNTDDIRNTKVAEVYNRLKSQYSVVECYDPFVNTEVVNKEYGINLFTTMPDISHYDLVIRMVNHNTFMNIENVLDIKQFL
jgi:UDP-N-acetyl-D-galactosamine dehydrogenase